MCIAIIHIQTHDPMKTMCTLSFTAIMMIGTFTLKAQTGIPAPKEMAGIHHALRTATEATILLDGTRYSVVNARYEACDSRKMAPREGVHIKCVTPTRTGWTVVILTTSGRRLMEGGSQDAVGSVLNGVCSYYDTNGQLRAQGFYAIGLKTGTWSRNDANGKPLTDQGYYGEDWDAMQLRIGMTTITRTCDTELAKAEF